MMNENNNNNNNTKCMRMNKYVISIYIFCVDIIPIEFIFISAQLFIYLLRTDVIFTSLSTEMSK